MAYKDSDYLKSGRTYQIISEISRKENGSYASEISKKLTIDRSYVTQVVRKLLSENVLLKGERSRAQYYVVNYRGLYEEFLRICWDLWSEVDTESGRPDFVRQELDSGDLNNPKLFSFYSDYLEHYLKHNREGTIREMLLEDFYAGLDVAVELDDVPKDLLVLHDFLKSVIAGVAPSYTSVNYAIKRYDN